MASGAQNISYRPADGNPVFNPSQTPGTAKLARTGCNLSRSQSWRTTPSGGNDRSPHLGVPGENNRETDYLHRRELNLEFHGSRFSFGLRLSCRIPDANFISPANPDNSRWTSHRDAWFSRILREI